MSGLQFKSKYQFLKIARTIVSTRAINSRRANKFPAVLMLYHWLDTV